MRWQETQVLNEDDESSRSEMLIIRFFCCRFVEYMTKLEKKMPILLEQHRVFSWCFVKFKITCVAYVLNFEQILSRVLVKGEVIILVILLNIYRFIFCQHWKKWFPFENNVCFSDSWPAIVWNDVLLLWHVAKWNQK